MNWPEILINSAITTALLGFFGFLLKESASAWINKSVSTALEDYKQEIEWENKRKEMAAQIGDLMTRLKITYSTTDNEEMFKHAYELQKQYWQLSLWLKPETLDAIHHAFESAPNFGIAHKQALIAVRRQFLGEDDPIQAEDLWHFQLAPDVGPPEDEDTDASTPN